jgi:hypothetical protein
MMEQTMTQSFPQFRNKISDAPRRFCGWIVSNYGAAKTYARATNVSPAMAEKRRQGVVPESFLIEQAKLTREKGPSWFFETFAFELAAFTAEKEEEARHARAAFENLRKSNQSRALDACDRTLWDRIED